MTETTPQEVDSQQADRGHSAEPGVFAGLSLFTGLGAVVVKSCCVLPLALAWLGIGGAGLSREFMALRPYFLAVAVTTLVIGWILAIRRNVRACQSGSPCARHRTGWLTFAMLGFSTVLVGLAVTWGWIEPVLVQHLLSATP